MHSPPPTSVPHLRDFFLSRGWDSVNPCYPATQMPELPDITAYIAAIESRILGQALQGVRLGSVFLLRTVDPPLSSTEGKTVTGLRRIGKRIAIGVEGDLWLVL